MTRRDPLRIMFVDDISNSKGTIGQAMNGSGPRDLSTTEDGERALRTLAASPVDPVVSGDNMSPMHGLKLLHHPRNAVKSRGKGLIPITGRAAQKIIDDCRRNGTHNDTKTPVAVQDRRKCAQPIGGPL
jgi:CheY-like chemotaxis protein